MLCLWQCPRENYDWENVLDIWGGRKGFRIDGFGLQKCTDCGILRLIGRIRKNTADRGVDVNFSVVSRLYISWSFRSLILNEVLISDLWLVSSSYGPVHTCPDIFESATFSFRIRLPCTRIRRIRQRIRKKINPQRIRQRVGGARAEKK